MAGMGHSFESDHAETAHGVVSQLQHLHVGCIAHVPGCIAEFRGFGCPSGPFWRVRGYCGSRFHGHYLVLLYEGRAAVADLCVLPLEWYRGGGWRADRYVHGVPIHFFEYR